MSRSNSKKRLRNLAVYEAKKNDAVDPKGIRTLGLDASYHLTVLMASCKSITLDKATEIAENSITSRELEYAALGTKDRRLFRQKSFIRRFVGKPDDPMLVRSWLWIMVITTVVIVGCIYFALNFKHTFAPMMMGPWIIGIIMLSCIWAAIFEPTKKARWVTALGMFAFSATMAGILTFLIKVYPIAYPHG